MKSKGGQFQRAGLKPRMHVRFKTSNPFPLNKPTPKNRAFMFGFLQRPRC